MGLSEILADPDDDEARAVHADALVEAGDPRGELIHLQLAGEVRAADRLLAEHGRTWFSGGEEYRVRRGFLEKIRVANGGFRDYERLRATEPITELGIDRVPDGANLDGLRGLELRAHVSREEILRVAPRLRKLRADAAAIQDAEAIELTHRAPQLEELDVHAGLLQRAGLRALVQLPLRFLALRDVTSELGHVGEPVRAERILLEGNLPADVSRAALAGARPRSLTLATSDESAAWLAGWDGLAGVERLEISTGSLSADTLAAILAGAVHLRHLALGFETDGAWLARAIAASPIAPQLESVNLGYLSIPQGLALSLVAALPGLRTLDLSDIEPDDARGLVAAAPPSLDRVFILAEPDDPGRRIVEAHWPAWWRYDCG